MGLGLYIVAYLVNCIENDPDAKIIQLVHSTFKSALVLKIKETYPQTVKQMKYDLKFKKHQNLMLKTIDMHEEHEQAIHEKNL